MRADRPDMLHLPRARFVAVGAGRERADWADVITCRTLRIEVVSWWVR